MKKIALTLMMIVTALTAMAELHPIDKIPFDDEPQEVIEYIIAIGYTNVELDEVDGNGTHSWGASNPTDNSTCVILYDEYVDLCLFKWQNEQQMPRLHPIEDFPYIGDGYFTRGKWKNNYIYNRSGGNPLSSTPY